MPDEKRLHSGYQHFPAGFFDRIDETDDAVFYEPVRMVTHIDDQAIGAVGVLYEELGIDGRVLDLMSSWISHFAHPPQHLTVVGMNRAELDANKAASDVLVHDLNAAPTLPYPDNHFTDAVCAVSVDYLTQPLEVFAEVARVVQPGGRFVTTFSNRCFPTKVIRAWHGASDDHRRQIVAQYFRLAGGFDAPISELRPGASGDPLNAVWATVTAAS